MMNIASKLGRAFIVSLPLVFLVFVHVPLQILSGNAGEFEGLAGLDYLAAIVPLALTVLAVVWLAVAVSLLAGRGEATLLVIALTVLGWIGALFLNWDYGPLVGAAYDFSAFPWRGGCDLLVWGAGLGLFWWARGRVCQVAARISLAVLTVMVLSDLPIFIQSAQAPATAQGGGNRLALPPLGNVIVLILDMSQSDIAAEVMAENPGIAQAFDGFRFFPDVVGAGSTTLGSTGTMAGAGFMDNSRDFADWRAARASAANPDYMPGILAAKGYSVCQDGAIGGTSVSAPKCTVGEAQGSYSLLLADLSLFRILPHFLKPLVYNDQKWLLSFHLDRDNRVIKEGNTPYRSDFRSIRSVIEKTDMVPTAPPRLMWMHFIGSHLPIMVDGDCKVFDASEHPRNSQGWEQMIAHNRHGESRAMVKGQLRCYLSRMAAILDRLRQIGVYDGSTIILASDHGDPFGNRRQHFEGQPETGGQAGFVPYPVLTAGVPLLAVKPIGAQGRMSIGSERASLCDIPELIYGQLGLPARGGEWCRDVLHDPVAAHQRLRRFHAYRWEADVWNPPVTGFPDIEEFLVTGDARLRASWVPSFVHYQNFRPKPVWTELRPADKTARKYLSVAGWDFTEPEGAGPVQSILVGPEARIYPSPSLSRPRRVRLEVEEAGPNQAAWVEVGNGDRFCRLSLASGSAVAQFSCDLDATPERPLKELVLRLGHHDPAKQPRLVVNKIEFSPLEGQ